MNTISVIINSIISQIKTDNITTCDISTMIDNVKRLYRVNSEIATISTALSIYHLISATDKYIIVAESLNGVFFKHYSFSELIAFDCFNITETSTKEKSIRLKVSKALKKDIIEHGYKLASYEEKEQLKTDNNLNNGQVSEMLVKRYYNINYHCDNLPFYLFGDIDLCYNTYQIKSHKATFCSIEQLARYIKQYGITKQYRFNFPSFDLLHSDIEITPIDVYNNVMKNTSEQNYNTLYCWYCCMSDMTKRYLERLTDEVFNYSILDSYNKLIDIAYINHFNINCFLRLMIDVNGIEIEEE